MNARAVNMRAGIRLVPGIVLGALSCLAAPSSGSDIYVNAYFEVRQGGLPTKYVFNGDSRIARGSVGFSDQPLVQRLGLKAGWNLRGVAVTTSNFLGQLAGGNGPSQVDAVYQWVPAATNFLPVAVGETLRAGAVVWLHAGTNRGVSIIGRSEPAAQRSLAPGGQFLAAATFAEWDLSNSLPANVNVWKPAEEPGRWETRLGEPPLAPGGPELRLRPGEVLFVQTPTALALAPPDEALALVYYHEDHLGSTACVSDARARLVAETAHYPFGAERIRSAPLPGPVYYGFARKERDAEHGLINFDSRLMWPAAARFIRVDSLAEKFKANSLHVPQGLNPYAYSHNNPLVLADPDGREARVIIGKNNRITIQVAIQYVGPMATKRNIAIANKGIEKYWTGKFGRYHVKMQVLGPDNDQGLNPSLVTLTDKDDKKKYLRSFVNVKEDTGRWNPRDAEFSWVAAHETGHLLGLDDRYEDKKGGGSTVDKGWAGNMMAETYGRLEERNITEILNTPRENYFRGARDTVQHHRRNVMERSPEELKAEHEALERDMNIQFEAWRLSDR